MTLPRDFERGYDSVYNNINEASTAVLRLPEPWPLLTPVNSGGPTTRRTPAAPPRASACSSSLLSWYLSISTCLPSRLLRELKRVRQIAFGYWGSMAPASHARDFDHARWYSLSASTAGYE